MEMVVTRSLSCKCVISVSYITMKFWSVEVEMIRRAMLLQMKMEYRVDVESGREYRDVDRRYP